MGKTDKYEVYYEDCCGGAKVDPKDCEYEYECIFEADETSGDPAAKDAQQAPEKEQEPDQDPSHAEDGGDHTPTLGAQIKNPLRPRKAEYIRGDTKGSMMNVRNAAPDATAGNNRTTLQKLRSRVRASLGKADPHGRSAQRQQQQRTHGETGHAGRRAEAPRSKSGARHTPVDNTDEYGHVDPDQDGDEEAQQDTKRRRRSPLVRRRNMRREPETEEYELAGPARPEYDGRLEHSDEKGRLDRSGRNGVRHAPNKSMEGVHPRAPGNDSYYDENEKSQESPERRAHPPQGEQPEYYRRRQGHSEIRRGSINPQDNSRYREEEHRGPIHVPGKRGLAGNRRDRSATGDEERYYTQKRSSPRKAHDPSPPKSIDEDSPRDRRGFSSTEVARVPRSRISLPTRRYKQRPQPPPRARNSGIPADESEAERYSSNHNPAHTGCTASPHRRHARYVSHKEYQSQDSEVDTSEKANYILGLFRNKDFSQTQNGSRFPIRNNPGHVLSRSCLGAAGFAGSAGADIVTAAAGSPSFVRRPPSAENGRYGGQDLLLPRREKSGQSRRLTNPLLRTAPKPSLVEKTVFELQNMARQHPEYIFLQLKKWKESAPAAFADEALHEMSVKMPVPPLVWDDRLYQACRDHVKDLGEKGEVGHKGSDGGTVFERINRYGRFVGKCGENIQAGSENPMEIVLTMVVDKGNPKKTHRRMMLDPKFTHGAVCTGLHQKLGIWTVVAYVAGID